MPLLEESGYDEQKHNSQIQTLKSQLPLPTPKLIQELAKIYTSLYGVSPEEINRGMCYDFAHDLKSLLGEGNVYWDDELGNSSEEGNGWHAFLEYRGRYYDSLHPQGVEDWRELVRL